MPDEKPEKLLTYVTVLGEIQFADNNRGGHMLLPDTGKSPEEAKQFYRSLAYEDKDGRLFIPELRDVKNAHEFFVGVDGFRAKVHEVLGTKNPPPRDYTPKMIALSKRLSDEMEARRQAEFEERYKPEWRDFEKRFRSNMEPSLEKLEGLSPKIRAQAENKMRERYRQHEKDDFELEKAEPDFYDPKTQGKYYSLSEYLHHDTDTIAKEAHATQKAKDLADQTKTSGGGANRENDRER